MTVLLITTCTNRKRRAAPELLQAANLLRGPQEEIARVWWQRVRSNDECEPALRLYCGRGFSEALATARFLGNTPWIISAGMGLIHAKEAIPPYDLTLARGSPSSIRSRILPGVFRADTWWSQLNALRAPGRSLAWLVRTNPKATLVVSLSAPYAELIKADLLTLDRASLNRVRIMGPASPDVLPPRLRHLLMPYDERLDGPDSQRPGTRSDLPQRAARHFVELITATDPAAPAERHRIQVMTALEGMRQPVIPKRRRISDEKLIEFIGQHWERVGGSAARMLRILRDEERVACEQGRLSEFFKRVKQQRNSWTPSSKTN